MWILQFIPSWIFYVMVLVGAAGFAATYLLRYIPIPALYMYKTTIRYVSIAVMFVFTFLSGAVYDNDAWLARVKELEEKVAKAEQQSKEVNTQIDEKVQQTTEKIIEKQVVLKQYVDREIVKYDKNCEVPKDFVDVVNKAAEGVK